MKAVAFQPAFLARAERFFQQDFRSVQVILSTEPGTVSALAFASGEEIHLIPETAAAPAGYLSRIMIHELAHVVQQRSGLVSGAAGSVITDSCFEAEADACAELFAAGVSRARSSLSPAARRPQLRQGGLIQPIRLKYMFIPAAATSAPADQIGKNKYNDFLRKVEAIFAQNKALRTQAAAAAHGAMVSGLGGNRAQDASVLLTYEKAHLQGGGNWTAVKQRLSQLTLNQGEGVSTTPGEEIIQIDDSGYQAPTGTGTASIKCVLREKHTEKVGRKKPRVWYESETYTLGSVLFGDSRFTLLKQQPADVLHEVYVRGKLVGEQVVTDGGSARHYVYIDNSDTYVKRFVVRGINHQDAAALGGNQPLTAPAGGELATNFEISNPKPLPKALEDKNISGRHGVTEGTQLTERQQILSHTRGWQKRYISTGVSKRDAYSTRGEKFDGIYGAVLIDLAKVKTEDIFDLHSPAAAQAVLQLDAMTVATATSPGLDANTTAGEEFLALRDVLRTRELLIKNSVAAHAVLSVDRGKCIVGIGVWAPVVEKTMLERLEKVKDMPEWQRTDIIKYKGLKDRYWFFMRFASPAEAGKVLTALRSSPEKGEEYVQLSAYELPRNVVGR